MTRHRILAALVLAVSIPPALAQHPERRGIGTLPLSTLKALGTTPGAKAKTLDERRSLFVTDLDILSQFSLQEVMDKLAGDSPDKKQTRETLFKQWWDTANVGPGLGLGPNCDASKGPDGKAVLNGFSYECPRAEGAQVQQSPFTGPKDGRYTAIALSNRFDLAGLPASGASDCGEYRIVFARNSGFGNGTQRNLIIFEAVLPNPKSNGKDLSGCQPVADFWAALSGISDSRLRAQKLKDFYFKGLPGFEPVVSARHYGNATPLAKGQIRSNQFLQFQWILREFFIDAGSGRLVIKPATVKSNPAGLLFSDQPIHAAVGPFQQAFVKEVPSLENPDINFFGMPGLSGSFDSGESNAMSDANNYVLALGSSPKFAAEIAKRISNSSLTPLLIAARAQALSCAGCHDLSNNANLGGGLRWPASLGFVHTSEQSENIPGAVGKKRFKISPALTDVFLPHRRRVLENFIQSAGPVVK